MEEGIQFVAARRTSPAPDDSQECRFSLFDRFPPEMRRYVYRLLFDSGDITILLSCKWIHAEALDVLYLDNPVCEVEVVKRDDEDEHLDKYSVRVIKRWYSGEVESDVYDAVRKTTQFRRFDVKIGSIFDEVDHAQVREIVRWIAAGMSGHGRMEHLKIWHEITEAFSDTEEYDHAIGGFAMLTGVKSVEVEGASKRQAEYLKRIIEGPVRCLPRMYYALEIYAGPLLPARCLEGAWDAMITDDENRFQQIRAELYHDVETRAQRAKDHLFSHDRLDLSTDMPGHKKGLECCLALRAQLNTKAEADAEETSGVWSSVYAASEA